MEAKWIVKMLLQDCRIMARADGFWIFLLNHSDAWWLGLLQFNWCLYAKMICQDCPYLYCNPDCSCLAIFTIFATLQNAACAQTTRHSQQRTSFFPSWRAIAELELSEWGHVTGKQKKGGQIKGKRELNVPKKEQSILRIENDSFPCQKLKMTGGIGYFHVVSYDSSFCDWWLLPFSQIRHTPLI